MTTVADRFAFVLGADTHARSYTYAIIATRTGARLDTATRSTRGRSRMLLGPGPSGTPCPVWAAETNERKSS